MKYPADSKLECGSIALVLVPLLSSLLVLSSFFLSAVMRRDLAAPPSVIRRLPASLTVRSRWFARPISMTISAVNLGELVIWPKWTSQCAFQGTRFGYVPITEMTIPDAPYTKAQRAAHFLRIIAIVQILGMVVGLLGVIVVHHFVSRWKNEHSN